MTRTTDRFVVIVSIKIYQGSVICLEFGQVTLQHHVNPILFISILSFNLMPLNKDSIMKKFFAVLLFSLFATTQVFALEFGEPSPNNTPTPFTQTITFVPNPSYTSYSITARSILYPKSGVNNQYKYTTISGVVLKDQSGNIISTSWTHATTAFGTVTLDNWSSSVVITGLTNGMTYTVTVTGTAYCVGATCGSTSTSEAEAFVTAS